MTELEKVRLLLGSHSPGTREVRSAGSTGRPPSVFARALTFLASLAGGLYDSLRHQRMVLAVLAGTLVFMWLIALVGYLSLHASLGR